MFDVVLQGHLTDGAGLVIEQVKFKVEIQAQTNTYEVQMNTAPIFE